MTTSCPYCGAALNLNFCVVCGRQGSASTNKMGNLQSVARNTDVTQRLEDPLEAEKYRKEQINRRRKKLIGLIVECILAALIIGSLVLFGIKQIIDYHMFNEMNRIKPWLETLGFKFPNYSPTHMTKKDLSTSIKNAHQAKKRNANKTNQKTNKDKHRS